MLISLVDSPVHVPVYQRISTHLSFVESLKPITDSKHFVPLRDAHPDSRADSSVHPRCRGTNVQHRHVKVTLRRWNTQDVDIKCNLLD